MTLVPAFKAAIGSTATTPAPAPAWGVKRGPDGMPIGTRRTVVTVGQTNPDYGQLIQTDPGYETAQAAAQTGHETDLANTQRSASGLLENYGEVPAGTDPSLVDPATAALANANTAQGLSTVAQINRAYQNTQAQDIDALQARGVLQSGGTGLVVGNDLLDYKTQKAAAASQVIDAINQLDGQYATNESGRAQTLAAAAAAAGDAVRQEFPAYAGQKLNLTYDPTFKAYRGSDGSYYDAKGKQLNTKTLRQATGLRSNIMAMRAKGMSWADVKKTQAWQHYVQTNNLLGTDIVN